MFVIDDDRRMGIHEANEDRQHGDGVPIGLIELLAYVGGVEPVANQAGFFADLA